MKLFDSNSLSKYFFSIAIVCSMKIVAQDAAFVQMYSNPMLTNPSFAGSLGNARVVTSSRIQWPRSAANSITNSISYDKHLNKLHGGFGFYHSMHIEGNAKYLKRGREAYGIYETRRWGFIYAPNFIIAQKVSITPSIEAALFNKSLDWIQMNFGDQIDPYVGFVYNTLETRKLDGKSGWDFSSGLLVNTATWSAGFATHHLTRPDEGLLTVSRLPRKFTGHASYTFQENDSADFAIAPNLFFVKQGPQSFFMGGATAKYKQYKFGASFRSPSIAAFMVGVNIKRFALNYSYETSPVGMRGMGGAHEVNFTCLFRYKK